MKIKQLIAELEKLDGELNAFVDGYEDGFDLITNIEPQELYKTEKDRFWTGAFHKVDTALNIDASKPFDGIVLFSNRRREEDED